MLDQILVYINNNIDSVQTLNNKKVLNIEINH